MLKSERSACAALGIAGIMLLPLLTAFFSLSFFFHFLLILFLDLQTHALKNYCLCRWGAELSIGAKTPTGGCEILYKLLLK